MGADASELEQNYIYFFITANCMQFTLLPYYLEYYNAAKRQTLVFKT